MIVLSGEKTATPLYIQIYQQIKDEIRRGNLPPKSKILSKRKLAAELNVSLNTVDTAYAQLTSEGYIQSIPQKGYYVCQIDELFQADVVGERIEKTKKEEDLVCVDFSIRGVDAATFPYNTWRKLMKNCFNEYDEELLLRSPAQGDPRLREAVAGYLHQARGVNCDPGQVVIGAGTDNLLQMLSYLLRDNCRIAVENPVYNEVYRIFKKMGHWVEAIDIDDKGLPVEPLRQKKIEVAYITPSHQFPLGISMPISRRIQLLNWANEVEGRYIIEDDYDSEFRYNTRPIPSLQSIDENGKVIYVGTFSKSVAPSLRISYMVLPESLHKIYEEQYSFLTSQVSRFEQSVLNEFIRQGYFETHVNKMRKIYKEKREVLVDALAIFGDSIRIVGENAGHHLMIKLKTGWTDEKMQNKAMGKGVRVYPISPYFIGKMPQKYSGKVLLGYAALQEDKIRQGVELLFEAWK